MLGIVLSLGAVVCVAIAMFRLNKSDWGWYLIVAALLLICTC